MRPRLGMDGDDVGAGLGERLEDRGRPARSSGGRRTAWRVCGRSAFTTAGPMVRLGTKCPSITSTWIQSAPASSIARTSSPSRAKSADRIEGAMRTGCCTDEVLTVPESRGKERARLIPALLAASPRHHAPGPHPTSRGIGSDFCSHKHEGHAESEPDRAQRLHLGSRRMSLRLRRAALGALCVLCANPTAAQAAAPRPSLPACRNADRLRLLRPVGRFRTQCLSFDPGIGGSIKLPGRPFERVTRRFGKTVGE